jgi:hypothetical protein
MSSNLAVIDFAVGGTLTVSGKTTLAETVLSSSSASFQGLSTTSLNTTGTSTFTSLPTSTQTPTLDAQFTTKVYVDTADGVVNKRITDTDSAQRTYIDTQDTALGKRITDNDTDVRFYIDASYNELNNMVSTKDTAVRTYIDASYNELNTRVTDTDSTQKTYIDNQISGIKVKPLFFVHQTANMTQRAPDNTMTKIIYATAKHNVLNKFLLGENLFGASTYGGFYQINASVCLPNITSGYIAIFLSGVEYARGSSFSSSTTSADTTLTVSTLLYMDGLNTGGQGCDCRVICSPSVVISGGQSKTFFTGHFVQE